MSEILVDEYYIECLKNKIETLTNQNHQLSQELKKLPKIVTMPNFAFVQNLSLELNKKKEITIPG